MFEAQAQSGVEALAKALVEADVGSMNLLQRLVVAGFFLKHILAVGFVEFQLTEIILVDELSADGILAARHKAFAHLVYEVLLPVGEIFVGNIGVVVVFGVAFLVLASVFIAELQRVAKLALCERQSEIDALFPLVFNDALVGVAKLVELPVALGKRRQHKRAIRLTVAHIFHGVAKVQTVAALELKTDVTLVWAVLGGTSIARSPINLQAAQIVLAV